MKRLIVLCVLFSVLFVIPFSVQAALFSDSDRAEKLVATENCSQVIMGSNYSVVAEIDEINSRLVGAVSLYRNGNLILMKVIDETGEYSLNIFQTRSYKFYFDQKKGELTLSW